MGALMRERSKNGWRLVEERRGHTACHPPPNTRARARGATADPPFPARVAPGVVPVGGGRYPSLRHQWWLQAVLRPLHKWPHPVKCTG